MNSGSQCVKTPLYEVASQIGKAAQEVRDIAKTKLGLRGSLTVLSNLTEAEVHKIRQHYGKPSYYREPTGQPSTERPVNISHVADNLCVHVHTLQHALRDLGIKNVNLTREQIVQVRDYFMDKPPRQLTPEEIQSNLDVRTQCDNFTKAQQAAKDLEARQGSVPHEQYECEKIAILNALKNAYLKMPDSGYPEIENSRRLTPWGYLPERGSGCSPTVAERIAPPTTAELETRGPQRLSNLARDLEKEWPDEEKYMEFPSHRFGRVARSITRERLQEAYRALGFDKENPFAGKTEVTPEQIGKLREYMKDNPFEDTDAGRKLRDEAVEQCQVEKEAASERQNARLNWVDKHAPDAYGTDDGEQSLSLSGGDAPYTEEEIRELERLGRAKMTEKKMSEEDEEWHDWLDSSGFWHNG